MADDGGRLLTVVAEVEPNDNGCSFPWGTWYHEHAPNGEYYKVPGNYRDMGISEDIAKAMLDLVKAGRSLPPEFVAGLPLVS